MKKGRPAKGYVFFEGGQWKVRVTTNTGKRPVLPLDPRFTVDEKDRAEAQGAEFAHQVKETGWEPDQDAPNALPITRRDETVSEWFARWHGSREKKLSSARKGKGDFAKWIEPTIGHLPIATLKRADVERVVRRLDEAIVKGECRWKTARNAWGTLSKMLRDACRSKVPALRMREDNPAANVEGPDRGAERSGPFLAPKELDALLACRAVPIARRRIFALATFTGLRRGELAALRWEDVDLDAGNILVHRALDFDTGAEKTTKTKQTRRVSIEPSLRPLLASLLGDDTAHVVDMGAKNLARELRSDLVRAGCTRPELHADDATRRPLDFHDLRHTYGTWRAIRGDDPLKIQRAMGHSTLDMTQTYINEAETFDPNFGRVFAPLPEDFCQVLPGLEPSRAASSREPAVAILPA